VLLGLAGGEKSTLHDWIEKGAARALGPDVVARFGPRLPFLLKVLAAEQPLSLQAHPTEEQARAGFEREQAAGIAVDAPNRIYKDPWHKPEMICAVTPFSALCGFRSPEQSAGLLGALGVPALSRLVASLSTGAPVSLREVCESLFALDAASRASMARAVGEACEHAKGAGAFASEYGWASRLAALYPGDPGIVLALMLNLVRLEPWEALYLGSGTLHAYLEGVGIEIMASSDNVLRGGMTPKYVSTAELLRILVFRPSAPVPVAVRPGDSGEQVYETPAPEFRLSKVTVDGARTWRAGDRRGPEIVFCWEGSVSVGPAEGEAVELTKGQSAFVSADVPAYDVRGSGIVVRAAVGNLG
jgi:mannose-6-phosphate isomerase